MAVDVVLNWMYMSNKFSPTNIMHTETEKRREKSEDEERLGK